MSLTAITALSVLEVGRPRVDDNTSRRLNGTLEGQHRAIKEADVEKLKGSYIRILYGVTQSKGANVRTGGVIIVRGRT